MTSCAPTDEHCGDRRWDYHFPVPHGYEGGRHQPQAGCGKDLQSPQEQSLGTDLDDVADTVSNELYDTDDDDLLDAIAPGTPSPRRGGKMAQIVDMADEWAYQKRKSIILAFLAENSLAIQHIYTYTYNFPTWMKIVDCW